MTGAHAPNKIKFGLEIHIMRQLQMLDEAGCLHIVAVGDDKFFVLRGRQTVFAEFIGPKRRSTSDIAMALRSLCQRPDHSRG